MRLGDAIDQVLQDPDDGPSAPPRRITLGDEMDAIIGSNEEPKPEPKGKRGRVTRVVDGDTVEVEGVGRVRLLGIDTPETFGQVERGGPRATRYLKSLAEGKNVQVEVSGDKVDSYGRSLANVYDESGKTSLAAEMLDTGLADAFAGVSAARTPVRLRDGEAAAAAAKGTLSGLVKGLIYPVSAFVPSYYKRLDEEILATRSTVNKFLQAKGIGDDKTRAWLSAAPSFAGELAGSFIPGAGAYGIARNAVGVAKAATFAEKATRTLGAASASGAATSAFAYLDNGESRLAHVAYNTAIAGAFETLGLPLLRRAWKQEVAEKAAGGIVESVAARMNVPARVADDSITAIRAGIAPKDVETARAIVDTIRHEVPDAVGSTVDMQAKKVIDTWVTQILPDKAPTIDPALYRMNPNYGVSFDIMVADQRIPRHIESSRTDVEKFAREMTGLRQQLFDYTSAQNIPVKIDNIRAHSLGSYNRFVNFLHGREGSGAPALKNVPGSAPEGTVSYTGNVPAEGAVLKHVPSGQTVTVLPRNVQAPLEAAPETPGAFSATTDAQRMQKADLPVVKSALPANVAGSYVWVKDGNGKRMQVKLSELREQVDLARPGKPVLSTFRPHPDGQIRNGMVDLGEGRVYVEPAGDTSGYFRDPLFYTQDPDSSAAQMPRVFIGDGQVTISVAPVERFRQESLFGKRLEGGPTDSIEARQHVPYNETQLAAAAEFPGGTATATSEIQRRGGRVYLKKNYESDPDEVRRSGFGAGFNPGRMNRSWKERELPPTPDQYGQRFDEQVLTEAPPLEPDTIPHARRSGGTRAHDTPAGYPRTSRMGEVVQNQPIFGQSRQMTLADMGDPHMVTARDTARVLLRKGMSPETRVNARLSPGSYAYAPEEQTTMTLRELANTEFSLTDLSSLQEEAGMRGLRAIPKGRGIILEAVDGSYRKEFSQQLEAVEAVGRIPLNSNGVKIEAELERAMGFGFERSFDADIDSDIFRPVEFMKSGIDEVVAGARPLVTVWSSQGDNLTQAVDAMAKAARVSPNAFQVMPVSAEATRGRVQYAIFNTTAVRQGLTKFGPALKRLGVDIRPEDGLDRSLQTLAARPHGLAFLYGGNRDPIDSLLYTFLRQRGDKETWSKAAVDVDSLGPHRKFSETQRAGIRATYQSGAAAPPMAGPERMGQVQMPMSAPPEGPSGGQWKDMSEFIETPPDFYFSGRDADGPPPMAEGMDAIGAPLEDKGSAISAITNRFRIPRELFKSLEANTGVPFYQWYSAIEMGRNNVENATKDAFGQLSKLARAMPKEDRKRVQLLLESKHSNPEEYASLLKTVSSSVAETAEAVEGVYVRAFEGLGQTREDVQKLLGAFPQVRQSGKDFKTWVRGRAGLPKPMVTLNNDLQTGTINLDERDLDFSTLARRVVRGAANAQHMTAIWDDVDHALKTFSTARNNSREFTQYFQYFDQYRREAIHQPDGLANSIHKFTKGTWKRLFGKDLPDDEVVDLVSTMTSFNYYANMAFQVGMVGRNYLQTLQTTYPALGARHTSEAVRWALRWRKSPALQEEMLKRGVVARDAYIEPLRDVQRMIVESNVGGKLGDAPAKVMDALDYGVKWYQSADNFNKVVAWRGQYTKAKEAADRYLSRKISWAQFSEESGAEMRVEDWASGLGLQVKEAIADQGNADLGAAMLAYDFAASSQFVYSRGNVPNIMQSTAGRLFGQYGTWPAYYTEFMINSGVRRGSTKSKVKFWGRWMAANTAIYGGIGGVFGADMARWTFFAPTAYAGGPIAQFAQQAVSAYGASVTGEDDPVARISKQRLGRFAATQVLPLPIGAARNYLQAAEALSQENYGDFVRRTLGLPKAD